MRKEHNVAKKKIRISVPRALAAQVLFDSDRICCVCREWGKPVQLHHIDENPANNQFGNLAVLCFDCHRNTQLSGGFDRKLDADQVRLYRDDWYRSVKLQRTKSYADAVDVETPGYDVVSVTAMAEALRENGELELLAGFYHSIGNTDLRDKYIELALQGDADDEIILYLRGLQGRPDLIPDDVLDREERRLTSAGDWTQRARMYLSIARFVDAAKDYLRGINDSLEQGNLFTAAFYAKEFEESKLRDSLFVAALDDARERGDLWWQIRALEELDWTDELRSTVEAHREEIESSGDLSLIKVLAENTGDFDRAAEARKKIMERARLVRRVGAPVDDHEAQFDADGSEAANGEVQTDPLPGAST